MWEWEGSRCCGRPAQASDCLTTPCWDAGAARPGNEFLLPGTPGQTFQSSPSTLLGRVCLRWRVGVKWCRRVACCGSRRWWSLKHKGEKRGRSHRDMNYFFLRFAWQQLQRNSEKWAEGRNVTFKYIQRSFAQFLRVSHDATFTCPEHLQTSKNPFLLCENAVSPSYHKVFHNECAEKNLPFVTSQKALKGIRWEFESVFSVKQHLNWKKDCLIVNVELVWNQKIIVS